MIKRIKIRFIQKFDVFYIQKKTFFGWTYVTYKSTILNEVVYHKYFNKDKKFLLEEIIKDHYGLSKDSVEILEYPSIKLYKL